MPVTTVTPRIGDREREVAVEALRGAYEAGCLDLAELEARTDAAWASRTQPELAALRDDLPEPPPPPSPVERVRDADVALFVVAMTAMVGIWLATGAGHPWPLWVFLGWGPAVLAGRVNPELHWTRWAQQPGGPFTSPCARAVRRP